jgi:hypothetical protein
MAATASPISTKLGTSPLAVLMIAISVIELLVLGI